MNPMAPMSKLAELGKTKGWRKLFSQYGNELGEAFVPGEVAGKIGPQGSGLSSRGFAGTQHRNPLMPDFAAAGPGVRQEGMNLGATSRVRKVNIPRNDSAEARAALRAEHTDNSVLGKLKKMMLTPIGMGAGGAVAGAGLGAAMSGGDEDLDPEILQMLAARGGGY